MTSFLWQKFFQNHFGHPNRLKIQSFAPSGMNFSTIWIPKVILTKNLLQKKLVKKNHSYLKYALVYFKWCFLIAIISNSIRNKYISLWHFLFTFTTQNCISRFSREQVGINRNSMLMTTICTTGLYDDDDPLTESTESTLIFSKDSKY